MSSKQSTTDEAFDYDQIIIGSGFGGSVSALRLSEKGYKVLILEKGLRRADKDYPKTNLDYKNYLWEPRLGFKGSLQMTYTSKVNILHGVGVGGGSQIYANVHLIPDDEVFNSKAWRHSRDDWQETLAPYYALAQRMLGTTKNTYTNIADDTLKQVAEAMGRGESYQTVSTGVLFPQQDNKQGEAIKDPYFAGDGPDRVTCSYCGSCIIGCRDNAKNTLMKNYLYFAERNGVEIRAQSTVKRIEPITKNGNGDGDGRHGYIVTVVDSKNKREYQLKSRGVVLSAGVMGTVPMLMRMRDQYKTLPNISSWLGQQVRTNSETLTTANDTQHSVHDGVTISSMISVDDDTTIEINRFRKGSDATWVLLPFVPMVSGAGFSRFLKFMLNTVLHPIKTFKVLRPKGKAEKSILLLVMQKSEAFIHLEWRRKWYRLFRKDISAVQNSDDTPLKVMFPKAEEATKLYAKILGGEPGSALPEIILGTPFTAHIISGVAIAKDKEHGVVDESGEVFGYQNLRVIDGSIVPGNLGVNPSLTITALAEHAMSKIAVFNQERASKIKPIKFSKPLVGQVSSFTGEGELIKLVNV